MGRTGPESSRRLPRHLRYEDIPTHTFTPRTYQVELLDAAVQQNTLVCLGATSSRMFLSVMLMKELGHQVQQPLDRGGKRGVFLVTSVDDIPQYALVIEHHTDLTVGQYSDDCTDRDDGWWRQEIHKSQTLVMLPSFFKHILDNDLLQLSQVSVLIFDHCQHVLEDDHPYDYIARKLQSQNDGCHDVPRILGLTSCFTSSRCQDPVELVTTIKQLEERFSASAETSTLVYSERYGMRPTEFVFECDRYEDQTGMVEELENILESTLHFLQECNIKVENDGDPVETPKTVLVECLNILYRLGPWCAASLAQMFVTQLEKIDKHETVDIKKKFLRLAATQLRLLITHFDRNFTPNYDIEELLLYTTPKVKKLIDHLRRFKPECDFKIITSEAADEMDDDSYMSDDSLGLTDSDDDDDDNDRSGGSKVIHVAVKKDITDDETGVQLFSGSDDKYLCGIVFVDHRYVAFALNKFIEEVCSWDDQLCFIKCHHITGHGTRGGKKEGSRGNKKQEEILRKFRLQELNLQLATDVLEEGVDIPKCNLIVKFDPPKDYRSYSQSKGRARARESEYVILAEKANLKTFRSELSKYKDIEGVLKGIWKASDNDDHLNNMGENINELYHDILPPYKPTDEEGGVQVKLTSAIALVNRYCAKLPSDAFTHLTPKCAVRQTQREGQTVYSATLRLPINSPLKEEIQSIVMPTRMLAKQAVALKTCEILHKTGEIDDQLLPIGKELFMKEEEESIVWDAEDMAGEARPGTTKRKQYYYKRLGSSFVRGHPCTDSNFLYLIHLTLTQPISDDQNTRGRRVYTPEETMRGFGLLSSKHIPKIPTFPLYTRSGEVTASLDLLQCNISFTVEELLRLEDLHRFVFTEVLRLEKDPMKFQPEQADLGYCIVPLNRKTKDSEYVVDWDFIDLVKKSKQSVKRNIYDSKREMFEFKKQEYEDAVVMPSYRNIDQPQHFYVAEIRSDLNPSSAFPSPELYKTFSEYYTTKYGLTVTNQEQPLLDVDHTSARLNLLTPRYMNQKGVALPTSSAETKKARRENLQQKQILVPELCEVHVFPSSLWRKAVCLPTILYRINYLLVAEEIRIKIATGAQIGQVILPDGFEFSALDFGFSLPEKKEENFNENYGEIPEDSKDIKENDGKDEQVTSMESEKVDSENDESGADNENMKQEVRGSESVTRSSRANEQKTIQSQTPQSDDAWEQREDNSSRLSTNLEKEQSQTPQSDDAWEQREDNSSRLSTNLEKEQSQTPQSDDAWEQREDNSSRLSTNLEKEQSQTPQSDDAWEQREDNSSRLSTNLEKEQSQTPQSDDAWEQREDNSSRLSTNLEKEQRADNSSQSTCTPDDDIKLSNNIESESFAAESKQQCNDENEICDKHSTTCPNEFSETEIHDCDQTTEQTEDLKCHKQTTPHLNTLTTNGLIKDFSKLKVDCLEQSDTVDSETRDVSQDTEGQKFDQTKSCDIERDCDNDQPKCKLVSEWDDPCGSKTDSTQSAEENSSPENEIAATNKRLGSAQDSRSGQDSCEENDKVSGDVENGAAEVDVFSGVGHFGKSDTITPVRKAKPVDLSKIPFPEPLLSLDVDIDLSKYIGPSPCTILQALTMSNANDFFSLERLETIGDSFLKYAITVYLYCTYPGIHEGKLSYLRSKQVSNCNLYRLGKRKGLAECMISTKFEPYENWLPPGYIINETKRKGQLPHVVPSKANALTKEVDERESEKSLTRQSPDTAKTLKEDEIDQQIMDIEQWQEVEEQGIEVNDTKGTDIYSYSLQTLHSIPDKSIADCVESLIGCYLTSCGKKAALRFMYWLGLKVLPPKVAEDSNQQGETTLSKQRETTVSTQGQTTSSTQGEMTLSTQQDIILSTQGEITLSSHGVTTLPIQGEITSFTQGETTSSTGSQDSKVLSSYGYQCPPSPLLPNIDGAASLMDHLLIGYTSFEEKIGYKFRDRAYLLQAFTHASYHYNNITDCYQRLEFLGDAILDYVITRHLYEDSCKYSPGVLTDLRSALVNNNIFAALAVKWDFHKYFKAISPPLFQVIEKFVARQKEREDEIDLEDEDENEDASAEYVELEVPKALGDIFESLAGAIYLDSGLSLDVVWRVYYRMMKTQIDKYLKSIPKSPVRELLEMEPETAKFEKPERTLEGKIRVTVNVVSKGVFVGIGRNYRIAKSAAAKKALRCIKAMQSQGLV